ncbi:UDP-N-acetylmuramoyl-tripeptide--D-alanyl-D-alanine ligase [Massilicoli timonensis]|uniref:UDP-N-acetylmuramoyl-tripeptide--D-alanyl-D- alanine ligase n=1 Tax=Massilicoli timonensis TaxID=2015901 RepID=UPI00307ABC48
MSCLWVAAAVLFAVKIIQKAAFVFQQCRYQKRRLLYWLKEHSFLFHKYLLAHLFLWTVFFLFRHKNILVIGLCIEGLAVLLWRRLADDRPAITARMKRLLSVCFLLVAVSAWGCSYHFAAMWLYALFFPLWCWILFFAVALLLTPIEYLIKRCYVRMAKQKLRSLRTLKKVGITGSYGKTSTKQILLHLIRLEFNTCASPASFNNEMGLTRTIREHLKPRHEVFLAEMGADHVKEITRLAALIKPSIAIITGIAPQHLQTFGSMEHILREKMQLVEALPANGTAIINMDNPYIRSYAIQNHCRIIRYGIDSADVDLRAVHVKVNHYGTSFLLLYEGQSIPLHTHLLGKQHVLNILAAIACARTLGISWDSIRKRVAQIPDVAHRMQLLCQRDYYVIDNAYNSNPASAAYALEVLSQMKGRKIVMTPGFVDLGDYQKEAHRTFGKQIAQCASIVILVGRHQIQAIYDGLLEACFAKEAIHIATDREMAFTILRRLVKSGDIVLIENDLPQVFNR